MEDDHLPPSARLGGQPGDLVLHEGVPDWLLPPLLDWLEHHLARFFVQRIALHLRISLGGRDDPQALREALEQRAASPQERWLLLDAVELLLRMNWYDMIIPSEMAGNAPVRGSEPVAVLGHILETGGSAYHVSVERRRLERRVGEHTESLVTKAADTASGQTADHLRRAWEHIFGLHSDPTTAYREAVRAVEAAACPIVLPKAGKPTLGTVIAHLKQASDKWEVQIPGHAAGTQDGVAALVAMLELLWTGQVSRHAGSPTSRDQLPIEAEAALPLAATLVHWFAIGAVRPR